MKESLKRLLPYLARYKPRLFCAVLAMIAVALFKGGGIYLLKPVIDNVGMLKDERRLILVIIALPVLFFIKMLAQYTQSYLMSWIGQKTVQNIREDLFVHLHNLSIEFYWRKRSGEVMARVTNDLTNVQSALQFIPLYFIRDTITLVFLLGVLFYINWRFTLVALLIGPAAGYVLSTLGRRMRKAAKRSQSIVGQIYHRFSESLEGMAIIKAFNYEEGAIKKFQQENDALFFQMMRYLRATALNGPLMEFLGSIVISLILYFGGREMISGRMSAGDFAVFLGAFFAAYEPLKNINNANPAFQLGFASWVRVLELLNEKPAVAQARNPHALKNFKGQVRFENVSYKYPHAHHYALKNINLQIRSGEFAAFVGASGSGKTTIVNLLLRLFDPTEGRVLYDGIDLRELDLKDLRSHLGLVSQTTILFDDTVSANIALGNSGASAEEIVKAAQTADAQDFILNMPQKYETMLGERGVKMSGGQRQKIAIARAVLKKPSLLILDEATSNLDTESEQAVQSALEKLHSGRTVITIAHRMSTVQNADKIYVIHRGEIIESGSHTELISKSGAYKKMREVQSIVN
ncbi:MAG: ABC transporter ATP-binding protein [Elusimicrobia bacterium]|nr:ABC transporter ATP-binding protein [Elusimicrobiota bacterium]